MSIKAQQKHAIIKAILEKATAPLTTREIYDAMEPKEQGMIAGGTTGLSKDLFYMRSIGAVESADGKRWKLVRSETEHTAATTEMVPKGKTDAFNDQLVAKMAEDAGGLLLHPDSELDAPFIQIISALREAMKKPEPVLIKRKDKKLDTLKNLGNILSDDIKAVLDDIAADIKLLAEAE